MFFKRARSAAAPSTSAGPQASAADGLRDELGLDQPWYFEARLRDELARASRSQGVFSLVAWRLHLLPGRAA